MAQIGAGLETWPRGVWGTSSQQEGKDQALDWMRREEADQGHPEGHESLILNKGI